MKNNFVIMVVFLCAACQSAPPPAVMSNKSAVELRAIESRQFQTGDRKAMLRSVIATLQDLGYSIDKVAATPGSVTATKLAALVLTVSLYPENSTTTVVRTNAMISVPPKIYQVDSPIFYQKDFFDPLAHALQLDALPASADGEGNALSMPTTKQ